MVLVYSQTITKLHTENSNTWISRDTQHTLTDGRETFPALDMSRPVAQTADVVKDKTLRAHKLVGSERFVTEEVSGTVLLLSEVPWAWKERGREEICFF